MRTALIGYTGFVGSNFAAQHTFDDLYNTSNIDQIQGREYDLVVSAANRADSHRINDHAEEDLTEINSYIETISKASIDKLVLISTVCIYPGGSSPDETTELSSDGLAPYGANRLHMEQVFTQRFNTLSLRLPQLYGLNLKKGIVYDLLNDYRVEFIRPQGQFQYYDLRRIWNDTTIALKANLASLNIATPPLTSDRIAQEVFGRDISHQVVPGEESVFSQMYTRDMRTIHSDLFSGPPGYLMTEDEELSALRSFVEEQPSN